jgi:DNA polymerase-4
VLEATGLHCSVGIGDTKVRAKIATKFGKPRGVYRLTRHNWMEVMGDRPTTAVWGVRNRIAGRMAGLGISTVRELAALPPFSLLDPAELPVLCACGSWLNLAPGDVLMSQGEPGDAPFF